MPHKLTPLYSYHAEHAKLTEFAGYLMPLYYESILREHMAVRQACGLFDVSHMCRFLIEGEKAPALLDGVVPSNLLKLGTGRAMYTLLLNEQGGILDDVIIMRLGATRFLLVGNAANREKDRRWLEGLLGQGVLLKDITEESAMLAVQGPLAARIVGSLFEDAVNLKRFGVTEASYMGAEAIISRTGYTGEDGFELVLRGVAPHRSEPAEQLWSWLIEAGAAPCGLGARDSLRLEAGYCLYGQDIDELTNPFEAGLEWLLDMGKDRFIGKEALATAKVSKRRVGLILQDPGVPRQGQALKLGDKEVGRVTSGGYSPTIGRGIGMGYVLPELAQEGIRLSVAAGGKEKQALIAKPPFYDQSVYGYKRRKPTERT